MAKRKSIWKTEKYESKSGKIYQRYVLDDDGNRVLRDDIDPNSVSAEDLEAGKASQTKPSPKRKRGPARKRSRRIVPDYIVDMMKEATSLRSTFNDGRVQYIVVIDEKSVNERDSGWMILRISKVQSDKFIFFNYRTQEWKPFDKETDKPGHGNSAIIWPEMPEAVAEENAKIEAERAEMGLEPDQNPEELSYYMRKKLGLLKSQQEDKKSA